MCALNKSLRNFLEENLLKILLYRAEDFVSQVNSENTDSFFTQTLLYGNPSLYIITNSLILNATIDFIFSTNRFEEDLF